MPETITTIIVAIISSFTVLISIWYRQYLQEKTKEKSTLSVEDKSMFYLEMDKVCNRIRITTKADGSYLAYFHNGGTFSNGISMDKFTVVGEDYNERIKSSSYKKIYYSTMINYISYAYHRLLINNRYYACTGLPCGTNCMRDLGGDCKNGQDITSDLSFRNDLIKRRISSIKMYLIKDPVSDKPIGFFALEYIDRDDSSSMNDSEIWKHQNRLAKLLNMTVLN